MSMRPEPDHMELWSPGEEDGFIPPVERKNFKGSEQRGAIT